MPANSIKGADFEHHHIELKVTPILKKKTIGYSSKERLVLGMINYMEDYYIPFEENIVNKRAQNMLSMNSVRVDIDKIVGKLGRWFVNLPGGKVDYTSFQIHPKGSGESVFVTLPNGLKIKKKVFSNTYISKDIHDALVYLIEKTKISKNSLVNLDISKLLLGFGVIDFNKEA
nr:MutH/Sau3AI family endonuclease [Bacillus cereus]